MEVKDLGRIEFLTRPTKEIVDSKDGKESQECRAEMRRGEDSGMKD